MKRGYYIAVVTVMVLLIVGYFAWDYVYKSFFTPTQTGIEQGIDSTANVALIETLAENVVIPWEVIVMPDGDLLVTERSGQLKRIGQNNQVIHVNGVEHDGEGGLLGLALDPDFSKNNYIYLYLTTVQGDGLINRVERYTYSNDQLSDKTEIISNIPGARIHDGGRIAFSPKGYLYITTGDAGKSELAQDTSSLAGKILRIKADGSIPIDNPFGNEVYSYGHRNPQGIAWDDTGRLWATEHGPSGLETGRDELNLIQKGGNYGWPEIIGDEVKSGMISPVAQSGADETWAPAGLAYLDGSLYFAGLRGQSLYQAIIQPDDTVRLRSHFRENYGRLRAVITHEDSIIFSTSNRDGRGNAVEGDDKIVKVSKLLFSGEE